MLYVYISKEHLFAPGINNLIQKNGRNKIKTVIYILDIVMHYI